MDRILEGIVDSHAHYDDRAFDSDRDILIDDLRELGIRHIVNIGCSVRSTIASSELADRYGFISFAAGIHPDAAGDVSDGGTMDERVRAVAAAAEHPKCVAIGEIGVDYHYDDGYPPEVQREMFERQLQLAHELHKPVVIHTRDAWEDTMALLRKYRPRGVVHCFSGSAELAREIVSLGMYVGFTGVVTFKNAKKAVKAAAEVPAHRLLIETDCPYMAPEPNRGQRNFSGNLIYTAAALADIKGMTGAELIRVTADNACELFGIK
ncbi:MAG: TatD family hydrolase [Huintestinicola sp.]